MSNPTEASQLALSPQNRLLEKLWKNNLSVSEAFFNFLLATRKQGFHVNLDAHSNMANSCSKINNEKLAHSDCFPQVCKYWLGV